MGRKWLTPVTAANGCSGRSLNPRLLPPNSGQDAVNSLSSYGTREQGLCFLTLLRAVAGLEAVRSVQQEGDPGREGEPLEPTWRLPLMLFAKGIETCSLVQTRSRARNNGRILSFGIFERFSSVAVFFCRCDYRHEGPGGRMEGTKRGHVDDFHYSFTWG